MRSIIPLLISSVLFSAGAHSQIQTHSSTCADLILTMDHPEKGWYLGAEDLADSMLEMELQTGPYRLAFDVFKRAQEQEKLTEYSAFQLSVDFHRNLMQGIQSHAALLDKEMQSHGSTAAWLRYRCDAADDPKTPIADIMNAIYLAVMGHGSDDRGSPE